MSVREFQAGDRVSTSKGAGTVVYRRMQPPDYTRVECYSVALDSRCLTPGYTGTILPAEDCAVYTTPTEFHVP